MNKVKQFFKSKTVWNGIVAIVAAVGVYLQTGSEEVLIAAGTGFIGIVLRYFTDSPMKDK